MTIAILIHALLFLIYWLTNLPFQSTLDNYLAGATGLRMNFMVVFVIFAGLVVLWSVLRLALRRAGPVWPYLAVGIFFLVFFYGSFTVLFVKNPAQLYRLGQLFQYFRFFVDAGALLFLAWGWLLLARCSPRSGYRLSGADGNVQWGPPIVIQLGHYCPMTGRIISQVRPPSVVCIRNSSRKESGE